LVTVVPVDVAVTLGLVAQLLYRSEELALDGGRCPLRGTEASQSERASSGYFTGSG
jgi:hypothetical protein